MLLGNIALLLNEVIMFIFVTGMNINYMIAKIFITCIVMIFNFITRKYLMK